MELPDLARELAPLVAPAPAVRKLFARGVRPRRATLEEVRATRRRCPGGCATVLVARRASRARGRRAAPRGRRLREVPLRVARWGAGSRRCASRSSTSKYVVCVVEPGGLRAGLRLLRDGELGFRRNLQTWEILDQVLRIRAEADRPVRGVVFMGMGEPLLNYDARCSGRRGSCATRRGSPSPAGPSPFSTAGWVPAIRRYVREGHPYRLAFSRHLGHPREARPGDAGGADAPVARAGGGHRAATRGRGSERAMLAYVAIRGLQHRAARTPRRSRDAFEGIPIKLDLIDVTDPTGATSRRMPEELARVPRPAADPRRPRGAPLLGREGHRGGMRDARSLLVRGNVDPPAGSLSSAHRPRVEEDTRRPGMIPGLIIYTSNRPGRVAESDAQHSHSPSVLADPGSIDVAAAQARACRA